MEVEKVRSTSNTITSTTNNYKEEEDDIPLPGFRFHPTDEELVGFYLRRKIEKRPIRIELIKQADIYKYDPWDLPKSSDVGDKEWYFFCKRGRKYRNSIRPNRVTGSGFWKATGIDKPIYSSCSGAGDSCIGLKKSLVYYRGSAGKGTKTDWMMHEFRLPAPHDKSTKNIVVTKTLAQEAEVWTLCRIFKRNISYRKCVPDWSRVQVSAAKRNTLINPIVAVDHHAATSQTCSIDSSDDLNAQGAYISFGAPAIRQSSSTERKPYSAYNNSNNNGQSIIINANQQQQQYFPGHFSNSSVASEAPCSASSFSSPVYADISELLRVADWEDLRSVAVYGDGASPFYL